MMDKASRIFGGSRSHLVILTCFCVGMIYVCSVGSGSTVDELPGTHKLEAFDSENGAQRIWRQQETRRALIRQGCVKIDNSRRVPSVKLRSQHLIVDDNLRIIYCYVPKVASTNWKRVLLSLRNPRLTPLSIQPDAGHKHEWAVISSLEDKRLTDRGYFKFLVVRNPFERLLSAYRNKFELPYDGYFRGRYGRNMKYSHRKNQTFTTVPSSNDIPSFEDFMSYISSENSEKNEHWQAVNDICHPCDIIYDFIGKYETFQQDSDFILSHITSRSGIQKNWSFPLRTETYTRTKPTGDLMELYYRSIPAELRVKLSKLFGNDVALFGYPKLFVQSSTRSNTVSNSSTSNA